MISERPVLSAASAAMRVNDAVYFEWPNSLNENVQGEILAAMNAVLAQETTIGFPAPLSDAEGNALMADLAVNVASGKKHLLLVRQGVTGRLVGHSILTPNGLPNCRHIAEISRTFVHPDFRGTVSLVAGMGEIVKRAQLLGVEVLQLDVRANTRIHRLWEAMGFQAIGIMQDYARVNGEKFAGCFMYQTVEELARRFSKT